MSYNNNAGLTGWKKTAVLFTFGVLTGYGLYYKLSEESKVVEHTIHDKWICIQREFNLENTEKTKEVLHLAFTPYYILENNIKRENYTVVDNLNNRDNYTILIDNKKYAEVENLSNKKMDLIKDKKNFVCKRTNITNNISDFTGKWVGYINSNKSEGLRLDELTKSENKVTLTIYNDRVFVDGENLPKEFNEQKILESKQEKGNLIITLKAKDNRKIIMRFRILNNKELELIETYKLNNKNTYFKRIEKI